MESGFISVSHKRMIFEKTQYVSLFLIISDKYTNSLLKRQCESEAGYSRVLICVGLKKGLDI